MKSAQEKFPLFGFLGLNFFMRMFSHLFGFLGLKFFMRMEKKPTQEKLPLISLPKGVSSHLVGFLDIKSFMRLKTTCTTLKETLQQVPYHLKSAGGPLKNQKTYYTGLVGSMRLHPRMTVRDLYMDPDDITASDFNQLMDRVPPNLESLQIGMMGIDANKLAVLQGKSFPKMKKLRLSFSFSLKRSGQFARLLSDYLRHLSETSPNLEDLEMNVPADQDRVTFIAENFKLKCLKLWSSEETWSADAALIAFGAHKQLRDIDLDGATVSNKGLEALSNCPDMRRISLYKCRGFDDEALASFLSEAKDLEYLNARGTSIGLESLRALVKHNGLQKLDVSSCRHLDVKAVIEIAKLPLKKLHMIGSNVSSSHVAMLVDRGETSLARNLERLDLNGNQGVTDTDANCIVSSCPKLVELDVRNTGVVHPERYEYDDRKLHRCFSSDVKMAPHMSCTTM